MRQRLQQQIRHRRHDALLARRARVELMLQADAFDRRDGEIRERRGVGLGREGTAPLPVANCRDQRRTHRHVELGAGREQGGPLRVRPAHRRRPEVGEDQKEILGLLVTRDDRRDEVADTLRGSGVGGAQIFPRDERQTDLHEEVLFGREGSVEQALRDAERGRDVLHACRVVAAGGEDARRGVDDLGAARLAVDDLGHGRWRLATRAGRNESRRAPARQTNQRMAGR